MSNPLTASIGIFRSENEAKHQSAPIVPNELFEAVERVIQNKSCEVLRTSNAMYIIEYRESGPFTEISSDDWLPVYVAKVSQWSSGGITKSEMASYYSENPDKTPIEIMSAKNEYQSPD